MAEGRAPSLERIPGPSKWYIFNLLPLGNDAHWAASFGMWGAWVAVKGKVWAPLIKLMPTHQKLTLNMSFGDWRQRGSASKWNECVRACSDVLKTKWKWTYVYPGSHWSRSRELKASRSWSSLVFRGGGQRKNSKGKRNTRIPEQRKTQQFHLSIALETPPFAGNKLIIIRIRIWIRWTLAPVLISNYANIWSNDSLMCAELDSSRDSCADTDTDSDSDLD